MCPGVSDEEDHSVDADKRADLGYIFEAAPREVADGVDMRFEKE